jgi:hypothetical protein
VVRFDLPQPVAPGASTTLDIDFFNQLPRVSARTGYYGSFHLVGQWFPKVGVLELPGERGATAPRWNAHEFHLHSEFYADYGEYDVRITVPKGYSVGATGEETGAPVERDGKVTHRFVQGDVHDFAWTADNRYAKPLEGVYEGPGSPKVKVKVLYHPGIRIQRTAGAAGDHRFARVFLAHARAVSVQGPSRQSFLPTTLKKPAAWSTRRSSPPAATRTSTRGPPHVTASTS